MKNRLIMKMILVVFISLLLVGQAVAKTVTLSWDASPSTVSGYKVYYKANSDQLPLDGTGATEGASPIDVGATLTTTITGLADADVHYFAVTAYDAAGYESSYSNMVLSPVVDDGGGGATNSAPVLDAIGSKQGVENGSLSFTVTASDPESDPLTYSASNLPSGASFDAATRTFSWTPDYSQANVYSVTFSVTDGQLSDSEVVSISISDVNRPPLLAEIGTQSIGEGSALSFTISGFDPDNDGLSYSASDLPSGAVFNPYTRLFSWTPPFETTENTRIYPVTFNVSDGSMSDSEIVTINVTNVNRAPVLAAIGAQSLTEGESINLIVNATDADNNSLSYSAGNLPAGAVFTVSTRSFSWIPTNDQAGNYMVTFSVSDGSLSDSETVAFSVANLNEAPVLDVIGSQSVNEGVELTLTITASDPENDSLTYSASGLPAGATFDPAQQRFSWTPDFTQAGDFSVTFTVTDGALSDSETVAISVANSNQSPTISGSPATTVMATASYIFTPTTNDPDGDTLIFSISNKPAWASFDTATGRLSGTPNEQQIGTTTDIAIGASDGNAIVFLPLYSIEVQAYVPLDSDGDGVLDHLDAFPNDANEWLDTDGDLIGNNADNDDDNDGVSDVRDGSPLDASTSGWIITATAGSGGFITPEGDSSVLYGGSQSYSLTSMAGYYVNDLLVDNVSVGTVASYQFDNVSAHHSIAAVFAAIPAGLSLVPTADGLPGVERVDGGDDSNNLVSSTPKLDLDYRFRVTLRDSVTADQRKVYLILDGYRYPMQLDSGALSTGAEYVYTTALGPAYTHKFYFVAEDNSATQLWRYPSSGELDGPRVELLNGRNLIGIAADIDSAALDSSALLNDSQVYRWIPGDRSGNFALVNTSGAMVAGEGYLLKNIANSTLPQLDIYGEISTATHEVAVNSGWNLIANPYKGNVALSELQVVYGANAPVDWLTAVADNLLIDGIYSYLGEDWGGGNAFASAAGSDSATMVPWIGYWIYVNPTEQPVTLLIPKPQQ